MKTMPVVGIDVNLFWQIINFIILVVIFKKYFFKKIEAFLEKRSEIISKDLDDAKEDKDSARIMKETAENRLKEAKVEANQLLVAAERKAESRKETILKEAHAQREKMIKSGEAEVAKMKASARKDLEKEARALAAELAAKIIAEKTGLDLIDDAIKKVGDK